jgi:aldehyde dehydrogenase (NAD+)
MSTDTTSAVDQTRPDVRLHIGDRHLASGSGGVYNHVDPATGLVDHSIPLAGADEVNEAVDVAHEAFRTWRRTPPVQRRELLFKLADLVEANTAEFARRGAMDNGTPISVGAGLVSNALAWIRYYAGWADKVTSDVISTLAADGEFGYTLRQPYGVIGIIITWNGPLISLSMKIPAALAAGNTVVVKPSELTPYSAELFADLAAEAGIPPGVINVLPGDASAGAALVSHPKVQKISFTGGPVTARKILQAAAEDMKPTVLELGGKSANILFEDADLDAACTVGTMIPIGVVSGQGCAFPTRMLVQDSVYDDVITRVTGVAKAITVGDPFAPENMSGPVVNQAAYERILGIIDKAQADGARLVTGGKALELPGALGGGYFIEPTVFADVDPYSDLAQNEVFGPVLAITRFATEEEAIEIANATRYGLSGYVQTSDLKRALRVAEEMITGEVLVNGALNLTPSRPFGGFGISGTGKEGGFAGIEEFLRTKGVSIA